MVYLFLAEGFEEIEALCPVDMLKRANIPVTTVSVGDSIEVTGAHGICVKADITYAETDLADADMLVLPGGMPGTLNLWACDALVSAVKIFAQSGGLVAAICAAPLILGRAGLLEGKEATCYPGFEDELKGATVSDKKVAVSDNIITAAGMGVAIDFSCALIDAIKGEGESAPIKAAIQCQ
jgi:4-methyl-5(b-hydroxyethyl)-thiazole monophosphate biosynthesis